MNKTIKNISVIFLMVFGLASCVKDRGNLDYIDLPAMELKEFLFQKNGSEARLDNSETIYAVKGDVLTISPNYDIDESLSPKYEWTLLNGTIQSDDSFEEPVVLSNEATVTHTITQVPGDYVVALKMTSDKDEKYNIIETFNLKVDVVKGVYVLHAQSDGNGDIDVVRTNKMDPTILEGETFHKRNFISEVNGEGLINPVGINVNSVGEIVIISEAGMQGYNGDMLRIVDNYDSRIENGVTINNTKMGYYATGNTSGDKYIFLVADHKLYAYNNFYNVIFVKFWNANEDSYFNKVVISEEDVNVVYNTTRKGFDMVGIAFGWSWSPIPPIRIVNNGGDLDPGLLNMDMIYFEKGNSNLVSVLSDGSAVRLCTFTYPQENSEGHIASSSIANIDLSSIPNISPSSAFEVGDRGDYVFCGVGNKLYTIDNMTGDVSEAVDAIPAGETITSISLYRNEADETYNTTLILVATIDANGVGSVHQFEIKQVTGTILVDTKESFTGFGKVNFMYYIG